MRLGSVVGRAVDVAAWPNGDPAPAALDELKALGYRVVATFDHRLGAVRPDPYAVSRLRLDADAPLARVRAVVSGGHPAVFHSLQRVRAAQAMRSRSR